MRFFILSLLAFMDAPAIAQAPVETSPCPPLLVYNQDPMIAAPLAALAGRTPADYPPGMLRAGVEAACIAMFDIDSDGKPLDVEARCNVTRTQSRFAPKIDRDYAELARVFAEQVVVCSRYEAASAASAAERWRANLMLLMQYQLPDHAGPPDFPGYFERTDAVVRITPEQATHYDSLLEKRNAGLAELRAKRATEKAAAEAAKAASESTSKPN